MNESAVCRALLAAVLFAVDRTGLSGIALKAPAGPVREQYLAFLKQRLSRDAALRMKKMPGHIKDERLIGGIDLSATLASGVPVLARGLLAEVDGGVLVIPMAERLSRGLTAKIAAVMDRKEVVIQREGFSQIVASRFGVIALDESESEEERLSPVMADRLAFHVDLGAVRFAELTEAIAMFEESYPAELFSLTKGAVPSASDGLCANADHIAVSDEMLGALCQAAVSLGVDSIRALMFSLRTARLHCALSGRQSLKEEDLAVAAQLVLAPRATRLPPADAEEEDAQGNNDSQDDASEQNEKEPDALQTPEALDDVVLDSAKAAIPAGLLSALVSGRVRTRGTSSGKSGATNRSGTRGRPSGVVAGMPNGRERLALLDTLRAAVPWQRLRKSSRMAIRREDFRVRKFKTKSPTTTIFVVDASGSSALNRLAEAKGAVETLLADCYVRRDQVAVIAFRAKSAELILSPTRSLVRAKRALSGLPGGGATPLALAMESAAELARGIERRGETPVIVLLTDAKANMSRSGEPGREKAHADALACADQIRASGLRALFIDTSPQPSDQAMEIALRMQARYFALPQAGAQAVVQAVKTLS